MEKKRCTRCKRHLPIERFRFDNKALGVRKYRCSECENARMREDRAKHGAKRRATDNARYQSNRLGERITITMNKYGLTREQAVEASEVITCEICGRGNGTRRLAVDHCHSTGKVRGLLCSKCNIAIGHIGDCPELARKMIAYLEAGGSGRW